ncbi:MAG: hypothetical protein Q9191_001946 [Dirinaria sp. TL-2023a]
MLRLHCTALRLSLRRPFSSTAALQAVGPATKNAEEIGSMLARPAWSVRSLFKPKDGASSPPASITREQLHHLLRLSALPLPVSQTEETTMLRDLQSQLRFVEAIQRVDTRGVDPLVSIRDEREEGRQAQEITLLELGAELEKEEVVGTRKRIRRKAEVKVEKNDAEDWNALACAPSTKGRFIALETTKT